VAQENSAVFTEEEQGRCLYHLGYAQVNVAGFFSFGTLGLTQPLFIAINALQHVPLSRAMIIRSLLQKLDEIEQQIGEAYKYLVASKLEQLELREEYPDLLEKEKTRFAQRLADALGVYVNPWTNRFNIGQPMNRRVARV
jgi:hypothetical protein